MLVVRPDAKSPAATKQVEFVCASSQSEEQIAAKSRIPTISGDVNVILIAAGKAGGEGLRESRCGAASCTGVEGQRVKLRRLPRPIEIRQAKFRWATLPWQPFRAPFTPSDAQTATPELPTQAMLENILRVDAGRIDNVLNLVGELIIGKSMLQQALNDFSKRYPKEPLRGKFADAMAFQARVLNDLQRSVMKIRMVPVDQLFRRFPRIVRDVARQCEREVDLELSGQETDLDKGILDAIAEPLTHLVRNAVSHGIEPAEQRRSLGKPPRGKIRLNALHQGNQVVVEISDDGRGIDVQKIRAKAAELGLISPQDGCPYE